MISLKRNKVSIILLSLFMILLVVNYLFVHNVINITSNNDSIKNNSEIIENTKDMNVQDFNNMNYLELIQLARLYYARGSVERSKEVSMIIFKRYPNDRDVINLLSAISVDELDFENSIRYKSILISDSKGIDLFYVYDSLTYLYLPSNIDKSIDYLKKAIDVIDDDSIQLTSDIKKTNLINKLNFLISLKSKINNEDSIEFYKSILNDTEYYIYSQIKIVMFEEYKNKYSSKYPNNFKELEETFNNTVKPTLNN